MPMLASLKDRLATDIPALRDHKLAYLQRIGGRQVVFGVEWYLVTSAADKAGIRQACRESAGNFGVLMHSHADDGTGADEAVFGVPANIRRLSRATAAASVAASVYTTAIVVIAIDAEHYWLLGLSQGIPILGKDMILGAAKTKQIVIELLMAFPEFELVGDAEFWRDLKPGARVIEEDLESLFTAERVQNAALLTRYDRQWHGFGVRAALLVIPMVIALTYYEDIKQFGERHWSDTQQIEQQRMWDDQVARENATIVAEYNRVAANHPIDNWIQRLARTVDRLKLESRGWRLASLECGSQLPYCTATWLNQGVGTFKGLSATMGHVGEMQFVSPGQVTQTITIPHMSPAQFDERAVANAIARMPDKSRFYVDYVSVLQALSSVPYIDAGLNQTELRIIGVNTQMPPDVSPSTEPLGQFAVGSWRLSGEGLKLLIGSLQKLDARVFFGKSLLLEFHRSDSGHYSATWRIEGDYVVKP